MGKAEVGAVVKQARGLGLEQDPSVDKITSS